MNTDNDISYMTEYEWENWLNGPSLNHDEEIFQSLEEREVFEMIFGEGNQVDDDAIRVNNFWNNGYDFNSNSAVHNPLNQTVMTSVISSNGVEPDQTIDYSVVQKRKADLSPTGHEGKRRRKDSFENPFENADLTFLLGNEINRSRGTLAEALMNPTASQTPTAFIPSLFTFNSAQPQPMSTCSTSLHIANSHPSDEPKPQQIPGRPFNPLFPQSHFNFQGIPQAIPQTSPPKISLISTQMTQAFSYASATSNTIYDQSREAIKRRLKDALPQIEELDEAYQKVCNEFSLGINPDKPEGMIQDMMPYQWRGYQWMKIFWKHGLGGCLADEMGLGKTIQAIALVQEIVNEKKAKDKTPRILIACPANLVENWKREIRSNAPSLASQIQVLDSRFNSTDTQPFITIASHQKLRRDASGKDGLKFPFNQEWDLVIVDEFHGFIASPKSQKVINLLREKTQGAERGFFGLTGTPMPNNLKELYTLNVLLNPDIYPSIKAFNKEFIRDVKIELKQLLSTIQDNNGIIPSDYPLERMEEVVVQLIEMLTKPFMLRRTKTHGEFKHQTSVMESRQLAICALPPIKPEVRVSYPLTETQCRIARAVIDERGESLNAAEEDLGAMSLFSVQQRNEDELGLNLRDFVCLQQLSDHPSIISNSEKLTAHIEKIDPKLIDLILRTPVDYEEEGKIKSIYKLVNTILEQAPNEKILIFTNYEQMGILLRDAFQVTALTPSMKQVQFLYGKVDKSRRPEIVNAFERADGPPVLITGRKLGTGWNCVKANHVIIADAWWNPNDDDQCIGRVYRIGQKKLVNIYRMHQKGFIVDDRMEKFRVEKKAWCELILSSDTSNIPRKMREILERKSNELSL